jgi:Arc/MetJ-type ribon-helix-helix transcriptional regulator
MVTRAFVIRQDQLRWLIDRSDPAFASRSEIVRYAIDQLIEHQPEWTK